LALKKKRRPSISVYVTKDELKEFRDWAKKTSRNLSAFLREVGRREMYKLKRKNI
jgi:hypothetical protein